MNFRLYEYIYKFVQRQEIIQNYACVSCIFWSVTKVSIFCLSISGRSEANFLFMVEKSATQGLQINNDCYVVPKLVFLRFTQYT